MDNADEVTENSSDSIPPNTELGQLQSQDQIEAILMASGTDGCDVGNEAAEVGESEDDANDDEDDDDDDTDEDDDDDEEEEEEVEDIESVEGGENELEEEQSEEDETESDEETETEDDDDIKEQKDENSVNTSAMDCSQLTSDFLSESDGDEMTIRCPICLARLGMQCVGSPESCDHIFCLDCILEWAKNVNTCPVDRQTFSLVLVRQGLDGVIYRRIPIGNPQNQVEEEPVEDLTFCEVCGRSDREDRLLLCDGCNLGYHLECLDPPLSSVPLGDWFCNDCSPQQAAPKVVAETPCRSTNRRSETQPSRPVQQIARTIVAERVRNVVARIRREQQLEKRANSLTSSSKTGSGSLQKRKRKSGTRKSTSSRSRKKRRKITRTKVKILEDGSTVVVKTRRRRRKLKRKGKGKNKLLKSARTKRLTPTSTKTRLAGRLGIGLPPTGRTIPVCVKSQTSVERSSSFFESRSTSTSGCSTELSILGNRDELDPFSASDEATTSQSENRDKVTFKLSKRPTIVSRSSEASSSFDVLGDIMQSQSYLHRNLSDVVIKRDGSLQQPSAASKYAPSSNQIKPVSVSSVSVISATSSENSTGNWQPIGETVKTDKESDDVSSTSVAQRSSERQDDEASLDPADFSGDVREDVESINVVSRASSSMVVANDSDSGEPSFTSLEHSKEEKRSTDNQQDSQSGFENMSRDSDRFEDKSNVNITPADGNGRDDEGSKQDNCYSNDENVFGMKESVEKPVVEEKEIVDDQQGTTTENKTSESVPDSDADVRPSNLANESRSRECSNQRNQRRSRSRSKGRSARARRSRSRSGDRSRRDVRRSRSRQRDRGPRDQRRSRSRERMRRDQRRSRSRSRDRRERRSRSREQNRQHDKPRGASPYRGRYYRGDRRRSSSRSRDQAEQPVVQTSKDTSRPRDRRRSRSRSRDRNRPRERRRSGSPSQQRNQSVRQREWENPSSDRVGAVGQGRPPFGGGPHTRHSSRRFEDDSTRIRGGEEQLNADFNVDAGIQGKSRDAEDNVFSGDNKNDEEASDSNWKGSRSFKGSDECRSRISVISSVHQPDHGRRDSRHSRLRDSSADDKEQRDTPVEYDPSVPTDDSSQAPPPPPPPGSFPPGMPPLIPPPFTWQAHDRMPRFDSRLPPPPTSTVINMPLHNNPPPPHAFFSRPQTAPIHQTPGQAGAMPPTFGFVAAAGPRIEAFPARLPPPPPPTFQSGGGRPPNASNPDPNGIPPFSLVRPPPQQHAVPPQPPHVLRLSTTMERPEAVPLLIRGPVEFQQLPRYVIMPPPTVGQPVHLPDPSRFAVCQVPQLPPNLIRLPVGQPSLPHAQIMLRQQLVIPPPGAPVQMRSETIQAQPHVPAQMGMGGIEQNPSAPMPPMLPQPMFDARLVRPPISTTESSHDGQLGNAVTSEHPSQHLGPQKSQQDLINSNNVYQMSAGSSRSPSLSPTESDEMMTGEIFSRPGINERDSPSYNEQSDNLATNSVRRSFLQEIPTNSDEKHVSESAAANGKSSSDSEPAVVPSSASSIFVGTSQASWFEEGKSSGDVVAPQPEVSKSSGPLDPRALLQYLLNQTRQTPASVSSVPSSIATFEHHEDSNSNALDKQTNRGSYLADSFNPSSDASCVQPVDMNVDSPDSALDAPNFSNDVYSPSQADYAPSPVSDPRTIRDQSDKRRSKIDRQNRVVEAVKDALKPHYSNNKITKEEYKDIMRSAVPKICHSKSSDIDLTRIQNFISVLVVRAQKARKHSSQSIAKQPGSVTKYSSRHRDME